MPKTSPHQIPHAIDLNSLTPDQRRAIDNILYPPKPYSPKPFIPNQYPQSDFADGATDELELELEAETATPPPAESSKHWSKSKTMWFNMGVTALGVASSVLPFAKPFIKPQHYGLITTAIGVGNMALRAVTKEKIHQ